MINASTGYTPFQLMFGRQASTDLDVIFGTPPQPEEYEDYHSFAKAHTHHVQQAYRWANNNIGTAIKRARRYYYNNPERSFKVDDKVWLLTPIIRPGQRKSFLRPYTGPWTVARKVNEVTYEIAPHPSWSRKTNSVVSIDRLKKYVSPEGEDEDPRHTHPPGMNDDLSFPGDDHLEDLPCDPEDDPTINLDDDPDRGPILPVVEVPELDVAQLPEDQAQAQPVLPAAVPDPIGINNENEGNNVALAPDPLIPPAVPDQPQPEQGQPQQRPKPKAINPRMPSVPTRDRHPRRAKTLHKTVAPRDLASTSLSVPHDLTDQTAVLCNRRRHAESQSASLHRAHRQLLNDQAEYRFRQAYREPASIHGASGPSAARTGRLLLSRRSPRR